VAYGGGAEGGALDNCTLTGNVAYGGGGVAGATLNNCIVYYNAANSGANYFFSTLNYCCALPAAGSGAGNITAEPRFSDLANGNLRLQSNSPCINAGANTYATNMTDLDGRPRLVGGAVDLGAYEYQGPGFSQFIPWLAQYGLATDGSADYSDADGDGLGNWQEWVCGTDPTNALSVLRLVSVQRSLSGATVSWQSVMDHTYSLERATRLGARPAFLPLASGIPGQPGITTFTDTNAPGSGPVFYRLGTEP